MEPPIANFFFGTGDSCLAYAAMKGDKWVVVIDGEEGPKYDGIGGDGNSIALSPDGKNYAYVANTGKEWFVVFNGEEQRKYYDITAGTPLFSPDSKHLFYGARKGNEWFAVMDGVEGENKYDRINKGAGFSSDSKYIMYTANKGGKWFVVINGKEGPAYDSIINPAFKDSKIEYFAERESDGRFLRLRQPYPDNDTDTETYKDIAEEIELAGLPEVKNRCGNCQRKKK